MNDPDEGILDRPGSWEIRTTIYHNGRKVAFCDTIDHETFDAAAYTVGTLLDTHEVTIHHPKPRAKP